MDNVLVDFKTGVNRLSEEIKKRYEGCLDDVPGIFSLMDPIQGAVESVNKLAKHFDLFVLSTALWKNPSAWSDKVKWIKNILVKGKTEYYISKLLFLIIKI